MSTSNMPEKYKEFGALSGAAESHQKNAMSTRRIGLCILCTAAILASCATTYGPRLSSDTASVRFVVRKSDRIGPDPHFLVAALSDEQCGTNPPAGRIAFFTSNRKRESQHKTLDMLGGNNISLADKHEVQVPVGGRFTFVFNGTLDAYPILSMCEVALSFDPQAGGQYEAEYRSQRDSCTVGVTRLLQTPEGKVVRIPEITTKYLPCSYPGTF
jgi:hypothetical protein